MTDGGLWTCRGRAIFLNHCRKGGEGYDKSSIRACSGAPADLERGSRPVQGYERSPPSQSQKVSGDNPNFLRPPSCWRLFVWQYYNPIRQSVNVTCQMGEHHLSRRKPIVRRSSTFSTAGRGKSSAVRIRMASSSGFPSCKSVRPASKNMYDGFLSESVLHPVSMFW